MADPTDTPLPLPNLNQVSVRQHLDVAAVHAKALEKLDTLSGKKVEPKHAALFFENVVKKEGTAQQQNGKCMACNQSVVSTGAFKFQSHIIVCPLLPAAVKKPFKELREGTTNKASEKWEVAVLQKEEAQIAALQHAANQQQLKQQCIRAGIHTAEVDAADKAIAKFFYANALPFGAASSEQDSIYREMVKAIEETPRNYVPPNSKKLGNELLDACDQDMWAKIKARDPDGEQALKFGSAYT